MSFRVSMALCLVVLVCANVLSNRAPGASIAIGVALTGVLAVIASPGRSQSR